MTTTALLGRWTPTSGPTSGYPAFDVLADYADGFTGEYDLEAAEADLLERIRDLAIPEGWHLARNGELYGPASVRFGPVDEPVDEDEREPFTADEVLVEIHVFVSELDFGLLLQMYPASPECGE